MGATENETRSSRVVSTQVHPRTRVSWLLLAGRSRDHLSLGSERWRRCGPPLHRRTQMTSAIEPQGWDGARCPAARAPVHRPGSASRSGGPALGAVSSSQAPWDWDPRTRPSSRSRWRKLPERREGASACCFPPAGRAVRRGGARAPEAIVGARPEHPSLGAPSPRAGEPQEPPCTPSSALPQE